MEFNKRTILWVVFVTSLVILWNEWMISQGRQSLFGSAPPAKTAQAPAQPGAAVRVGAASVEIAQDGKFHSVCGRIVADDLFVHQLGAPVRADRIL